MTLLFFAGGVVISPDFDGQIIVSETLFNNVAYGLAVSALTVWLMPLILVFVHGNKMSGKERAELMIWSVIFPVIGSMILYFTYRGKYA